MSFEPKNYHVGLVDFFSVILPGAALAYLGKEWVTDQTLPFLLPGDQLEGTALFLFISYVLGHFIFLLGSFLDDLLYDPMRTATDYGQIGRLADKKGLSPAWLRSIVGGPLLFDKKPDEAVICVSRHKARVLHALGASRAVNAYHWSKARLSKENPQGLAAVERFEADSKFFRSFVVVALGLAIFWLARGQLVWAGVSFGFCSLAFVRYVGQRFKATQQAYWGVIALDGARAKSKTLDANPPRQDGVTHAAGLVFKGSVDNPQYLLVAATEGNFKWTFPFGPIFPGEKPEETAVREVFESTGLWAKLVNHVSDETLDLGGTTAKVRIYLLQLAGPETSNSEKFVKSNPRWVMPATTQEAAETREPFGRVLRGPISTNKTTGHRSVS